MFFKLLKLAGLDIGQQTLKDWMINGVMVDAQVEVFSIGQLNQLVAFAGRQGHGLLHEHMKSGL